MVTANTQPFSTAQSDSLLVTLQSPSGILVTLASPGASLLSWHLPDRLGHLRNVVLSLADRAKYFGNPFYAGAVLGPNAGRITNALLPVGSEHWKLTANDGPNNLHGGFDCASFRCWSLQKLWESEAEAGAVFSLSLPDGLDGFPGNRELTVTYTLLESGSLSLTCRAVTDKPTYLNLSSHTYFNLSGDFSRSALHQKLSLAADFFITNSASHLPHDVRPVADTPFDFRNAVSLYDRIRQYPCDPQLQNAHGYNNGFVLKKRESFCPAAVLTDSAFGRQISLFTDAPCLVLYSGGYLNDAPEILTDFSLNKKSESVIRPTPSCALALEAQDFPDAPNSPLFPAKILLPGEVFTRRIEWRFDLI